MSTPKYALDSVEDAILANTWKANMDLLYLKFPHGKQMVDYPKEVIGDVLAQAGAFSVEETPDGNYAFTTLKGEVLYTMDGFKARQAIKRGEEMGLEPSRCPFSDETCRPGDPAFFVQWAIDQLQQRKEVTA